MVGDILGKGYVVIFILMAVSIALEHDTPYLSFESGLGNPFVSHSTCYKFICWVVFESLLPSPWSCHSYVQEKFTRSPLLRRPSVVVRSYYVGLPWVHFNPCSYFVSSSKYVTYFMSLMGDTSRPSCDESCSIDSNSLSKNET
jgi:hypothetical protein